MATVAGCAVVLALAGSAAGAAGDLDPSFGAGGIVEGAAIGVGGSEAQDLLLLPNGDMIAAGFLVTAFTTNPFTIDIDFALVRYDANGVPDPSFGSGGVARAEFASGIDRLMAVVRQPDGKLVAAGWSQREPDLSDIEFALARYNADGTLDSTFSGDGKLTTNFTPLADEAFDVVIDGAGRILVVGVAGLVTFATGPGDFALARFNPDGTPDLSFGPDGKQVIDFAGSTSSYDIAYGADVQADGKVVVAGTAGRDTGGALGIQDFALIRLNADGSLDPTFGSGGRVSTPFTDATSLASAEASSVAIASDGAIVVAGRRGPGSGGTGNDFALARYLPNGALDPAFGADGTTTLDFVGGHDEANDIVINPVDGKIVLGGSMQTDSLQFGLARFNGNGSLDTGFGSGGKVTTQIGNPIGASTQGNALALQTDGKIVLAGGTQSSRIGLARYLAVGVSDTTPPQIGVPATVLADATSPTGAAVFFDVVAEDDVDGQLPTTCVPQSDSEFPIGDTEVVCEATDAAGNTASASFVVHVKGGPEQISDLSGNLVVALGGAAPPRPVREALERAATQAAGKRPSLACVPLSIVSGWIRVSVQLGKIGPKQGNVLIADIARIKSVIGC